MKRTQLVEHIQTKQNYLCVGLDTDIDKIPKHLRSASDGILQFNKAVIDATKEHCVSYKINTAFYEAMGVKGWQIIEETLNYIPDTHFKIADAKRGDIGNTSAQYAKTFFETFPFDAVTVAPYMGEDSVRPFLEYENKWTIVLGLTSNKGSEDFQKLVVQPSSDFNLVPHLVQPQREQLLYQSVLEKIASWGTQNNLMFVIGATRANDLEAVRSIIPEHFLLVPGVGAQGGSLEEVTKYGKNNDCGLLVNVSRAVIYAGSDENYTDAVKSAANEYHTEMKQYLS
jgi:orotidine-5'-phosphate decarboxylase